MTHPPEDHTKLDRLLRQIRFTPRSSLGAEILGRARRGEQAPTRRVHRIRYVLGISMAGGMVGLGFLVFSLLALQPLGLLTVDRCCQDLDGGGDADDGLVVVTQKGEQVKRLAIYEDRDGSRSFTPADKVRFQRNGSPASAQPIADGARTVQFCCLDYDGGGPDDDALLVIGVPPGQISMAAIYEHRPTETTIRLR
jgi:hypothetical protein